MKKRNLGYVVSRNGCAPCEMSESGILQESFGTVTVFATRSAARNAIRRTNRLDTKTCSGWSENGRYLVIHRLEAEAK
jgi:hypothetical protein